MPCYPRQPSVVISSTGRTASAGWVVSIDNWCPASKNHKVRWRRWHSLRKVDDAIIALALGPQGCEVPKAQGKRWVSLVVHRKNRKSLPDPQNLEESFFDALKNGGFLVDDKHEFMDAPRTRIEIDSTLPVFVRSVVTVEEIG